MPVSATAPVTGETEEPALNLVLRTCNPIECVDVSDSIAYDKMLLNVGQLKDIEEMLAWVS